MSPADGDERDVLTSLPRARPTRRSAKRTGTAPGAPERPATPPAATAGADAATAGEPKAATAPGAKAATAGQAKAKRGAPDRAKPRAPRASAAPKAAGARRPKAAPPAPSAVPPAGWATPAESRRDAGTGQLVGTALQAVGELAQIGVSYGGRSLRQALSRLPRP